MLHLFPLRNQTEAKVSTDSTVASPKSDPHTLDLHALRHTPPRIRHEYTRQMRRPARSRVHIPCGAYRAAGRLKAQRQLTRCPEIDPHGHGRTRFRCFGSLVVTGYPTLARVQNVIFVHASKHEMLGEHGCMAASNARARRNPSERLAAGTNPHSVLPPKQE